MVLINPSNLASILEKKAGVKLCSGVAGGKCYRPRRANGRLCLDCHRAYMKQLRSKGNERERVIDGYDFNQDHNV